MPIEAAVAGVHPSDNVLPEVETSGVFAGISAIKVGT